MFECRLALTRQAIRASGIKFTEEGRKGTVTGKELFTVVGKNPSFGLETEATDVEPI